MASFNLPIFIWGAASASTLLDQTNYKTLTNTVVDTYTLGVGIRSLLLQYSWMNVALIYTVDIEQRKCDFLQQDLESALGDTRGTPNPSIVYKHLMQDSTETTIKQTLTNVQARARSECYYFVMGVGQLIPPIPVVVVCFDSDIDKRNFLVWVDDLKMNTDEYVYIFPDLRAQGMLHRNNNGSYADFWLDTNTPPDGKDEKALRTAQKSLAIDIQNQALSDINDFNNQVVSNFGQPPFYCNGTCLGPSAADYTAAVYASYLHDAMYLYALTINRTMGQLGSGPGLRDALRNGTFVCNMSRGEFIGRTGLVRIDSTGKREPVFWVTGLDAINNPTVWLNVSIVGDQITVTPQYNTEATSIWGNRVGGARPLDNPVCGYSGNECPVNVTLYIVLGGALIIVMVSIAAGGIGYAVREKSKEQARLNRECLISTIELKKIDPDAKSTEALKSLRSFHSSTGSNDTGGKKSTIVGSSIDANKLDTEHHAFYNLNTAGSKETVYAEKYPIKVKLSQEDMNRLRKLRQFDHDNANKFLGICLDGVQLLAVWKYCHRGSLQDVIAKESYVADAFVMFALMRDITNGLAAIHSSPVGAHGSLTSQNCLVNDRWQLKIAGHGLDMITEFQPLRRKSTFTFVVFCHISSLTALCKIKQLSLNLLRVPMESTRTATKWRPPRYEGRRRLLLRHYLLGAGKSYGGVERSHHRGGRR